MAPQLHKTNQPGLHIHKRFKCLLIKPTNHHSSLFPVSLFFLSVVRMQSQCQAALILRASSSFSTNKIP